MGWLAKAVSQTLRPSDAQREACRRCVEAVLDAAAVPGPHSGASPITPNSRSRLQERLLGVPRWDGRNAVSAEKTASAPVFFLES
jgi:hypothetical protein